MSNRPGRPKLKRGTVMRKYSHVTQGPASSVRFIDPKTVEIQPNLPIKVLPDKIDYRQLPKRFA